jgi:hypothetical protein
MYSLTCANILISTVAFHNKLISYGEELLAPHPTLKLEDQPCRLSATDYSYLEVVFSVHNLRIHHAVVTRDPPNMDENLYEN